MSEEYVMLQYENEKLRLDLIQWMKLASDAQAEIEGLKHTLHYTRAENDEYHRINERIWETTKKWIQEDSAIISKQAGQIQYLTKKIRVLDAGAEKKVVVEA